MKLKRHECIVMIVAVMMVAFALKAFEITAMAQGTVAGTGYMTAGDEHVTSSEDFIVQVTFSADERVPMEPRLQEFLHEQCSLAGIDYAFALAIIEHESTFRAGATHTNRNGSIDRGIMQVNSSNIKKLKKLGYIQNTEDLFNPCTNIECGLALLYPYVEQFGNCEQAYAAYNTGRTDVRSNKNSRTVMKYWEKWKEIVG